MAICHCCSAPHSTNCQAKFAAPPEVKPVAARQPQPLSADLVTFFPDFRPVRQHRIRSDPVALTSNTEPTGQ